MSTLHVLMPPLARMGDGVAFLRWLARGDRLPDTRNARTTTLREWFHFPGATIPAAALRHCCHVADAEHGLWACADPAWVRSEATGARLMACPVADLAVAEANELAASLQPLLSGAAGPLALDTPSSWCVEWLHGAIAAAFPDPADAVGVSLIECLPEGDVGRGLRRLFNEVQIALHAHPVNAARVAAGKTPVNALWFWGAGALPQTVETGLRVVASVDDVVRGLAKLGGAVRVEPLPEALESAHDAGAALLDLDLPGQADDADQWLVHFQRWLRERRFGAITLAFASGECFRLRHLHRLRLWRRG